MSTVVVVVEHPLVDNGIDIVAPSRTRDALKVAVNHPDEGVEDSTTPRTDCRGKLRKLSLPCQDFVQSLRIAVEQVVDHPSKRLALQRSAETELLYQLLVPCQ